MINKEDLSVLFGILQMVKMGHPIDDEQKKVAGELSDEILSLITNKDTQKSIVSESQLEIYGQRATAEKSSTDSYSVSVYTGHMLDMIKEIRASRNNLIGKDQKTVSPLNDLCTRAHGYAKRNGFYDDEDGKSLALKLLLIHSEVSEAAEEIKAGHGVHQLRYRERDGKPEGFGIEVADILIRCFDLCGYVSLDLDKLVKIKMDFNETREYKHGDKF